MFRFRKSMVLLIVLIGVNSNALGKTVEELKKAGDLRGLVAKLSDRQASVRRDAAVALPGVAEKVKDPATLNSVVGRLIEVRMSDPWKSTREYSGRALMYALNKSKDQGVLNNSVSPLLDALDRGQVDLERRRYASLALFSVVMRLERVDQLRPRFSELLSSALKDPDEGVRKYAERALQHTLQKLNDEPTLTIAAQSLAGQLDDKNVASRSYAAVMLSGVVRKIKDPRTLKGLLGPVTTASKDRDKGVREYAGRSLQHIQSQLKASVKAKVKAPPKKATAPAKGESKRADNSPAATETLFVALQTKARQPVRKTTEQTIADVQKAGNARGLIALLTDPRGNVRRRAAFALRQIVGKVKDPATLDASIGRLIEVAFKDPWKSTRGDCSGILEHLLNKTENQAVLRSTLRPIFDALPHGQVDQSRRHYAATLLYVVTRRLDHIDQLMAPRMDELLSATLSDPYEHVREYAGRALGHSLNKITDEKTLSRVAHRLVADQVLKSGDEKNRRYAAEQLYNLVRKIKDPPDLRALLGRITAATKDRDERVRQDADRAMRQIQNGLKRKKEKKPAAPAKVTAAVAKKSHNIARTSNPLRIDGRLDEPAWKSTRAVGAFDFTWWKNGDGPKQPTEAKLLWDDKYLYVAFHCTDTDIHATQTQRDSAVYRDDCVLLFASPFVDDPKRYFHLEINALGTHLDKYRPNGARPDIPWQWNPGGILIATSHNGTPNDDGDVDKSWTVEVGFPYAALGRALPGPPRPGDKWHVNLHRTEENTRVMSQWSRGDRNRQSFHTPELFGVVTFVD